MESQTDPATDPLLVYFIGGPGCSSMFTLLQESGPYVLRDGEMTFSKNEFAWNNETNILYIDSPAGVGFSTCNNLSHS